MLSAIGKNTLILLVVIWLAGCASSPPRNPGNICDIFDQKGRWYRAARDSYRTWGVPMGVQLAIIYQESRFDDDAKPPRRKLLWVIPWKRKSSAYGYGQVLDSTWNNYRRSTGRRGADRDDFDDVVDFIGWYGSRSHRMLGIRKDDAYSQYLAYHEGPFGYRKKSYRKKPWLLKVARRVDKRSKTYNAQLQKCQDDLEKGWFFWPF